MFSENLEHRNRLTPPRSRRARRSSVPAGPAGGRCANCDRVGVKLARIGSQPHRVGVECGQAVKRCAGSSSTRDVLVRLLLLLRFVGRCVPVLLLCGCGLIAVPVHPAESNSVTSAATSNAPAIAPATNRPPAPPPLVFPPEFNSEDRALVTQGELVYRQLCFACHGLDGKGLPLTSGPPGATMAPSLVGDRIATGVRDGAINVVLKGLIGPVDGKTYSAVMAHEEFNSDAWIASVVSYARSSFGNRAPLITTNEVTAIREAFTNRETPWTMPELLASLPPPLTNRAGWKLSASHNSRTARSAVETNATSRYDSRVTQQAGMWFQIEFARLETIAGLEFDSGAATEDFPRVYELQISRNGRVWGLPIAVGRGTGPQIEMNFAPVETRFIRITLTAPSPHRWSIHNLQILAPAPPPLVAGPPPKPEPSKYD